jgi:phosphodiesterase/alkaline phosphatase D-like protein
VKLILGPVLRHVGETTASVWVQTEGPAEVSVLGCTARTFEVQGHHYALVPVTGLEPDTWVEYTVEVDGERAWPPPHHPFPPSAIRTRGRDTTLRIIFGSCRYPKTGERKLDRKIGLDALDSYAARLAGQPVEDRPDLLILLGDQVYADELTPESRRHLAGRRRGKSTRTKRPPDEVVSFDEYERLYRSSWSDPEIRWVMSTVPTAMIFDDHDVRDDWNTSAAWRAQMADTDWWPERIQAALASYWVYQHLGNLDPAALDADDDFRRVREADGDTWPLVSALARRADEEVDGNKGVRFSYRWDLGRTRLVMIDSRNGRILDTGERMMLGEQEFAWVTDQIRDGHDIDHLLLGTSLPWLMPPAIGAVQSVNEVEAHRDDRWGRRAEWLRQAADLEHWPAFMASFLRLAGLISEIANRPDAPATVSVLSGDVHHSYAARAELDAGSRSAVHQVVCSPVHNYVPVFMKPVFRLGWSHRLAPLARRWATRHGVPELPLRWTNVAGPVFGNTIATLLIRGRDAELLFEQPRTAAALDEAARVPLSDH